MLLLATTRPTPLLTADQLGCPDCHQPNNRIPPLLRWMLVLLVVSLIYDYSNNWKGCRSLLVEFQQTVQQLPNQPNLLK